jgi:hypothetical protein
MPAVASGASIPSGIVGAHAGGHLSAVRDAPADRSRRRRLHVHPMRCAMGVRHVRELRPAVPHAARRDVVDLSELWASERSARSRVAGPGRRSHEAGPGRRSHEAGPGRRSHDAGAELRRGTEAAAPTRNDRVGRDRRDRPGVVPPHPRRWDHGLAEPEYGCRCHDVPAPARSSDPARRRVHPRRR